MQFRAIIQRIHLWTGLLLGAQVLLWMVSGFYMSWFALELVRGETNAFPATPPELETTSYASPGGVIAQMDGATSLELRSFLGDPVYEATSAAGVALFSARSGEKISPITEEKARVVAERDYVGDAKIVKLELMSETPYEYRSTLPVWRADFDDKFHTRLYISRDTGEIVSRRNDIWRVFDFLWMLHIMDYDGRDNFNNPLLKAASATGLIFALSGAVMVVLRLRQGRYANDVRLLRGKKNEKRK